ncbi:hemerythrin domain-containing protein [Kitasatospora paranensis]|uniref:Hemerythrin domain-containing protein n=1 Tax=Kitasatospora paranensis TaxID=258053 RepID=A0ABW2FSW2_9ACTN
MAGHGTDVVTRLEADHRAVEALFVRLGTAAAGERRELVDTLADHLLRHATAERTYLHPAIRRYVLGGRAMADREIDDHAGIRRLIGRLHGAADDDPGTERLRGRLLEAVHAHVREEELHVFPALRAAAGQAVLDALGEQLHTCRYVQPHAAHRPCTPPGRNPATGS